MMGGVSILKDGSENHSLFLKMNILMLFEFFWVENGTVLPDYRRMMTQIS
jgi:hypothetical protein